MCVAVDLVLNSGETKAAMTSTVCDFGKILMAEPAEPIPWESRALVISTPRTTKYIHFSRTMNSLCAQLSGILMSAAHTVITAFHSADATSPARHAD